MEEPMDDPVMSELLQLRAENHKLKAREMKVATSVGELAYAFTTFYEAMLKLEQAVDKVARTATGVL